MGCCFSWYAINKHRFLLYVIDLFGKYVWVAPLKYKNGMTIINAFQNVLNRSDCKPNKIWLVKGSEFHNSSFKKWLKEYDIEIYSTRNEGASVAAERFIRNLKNKIFKHMTSISKIAYIDKFRLDDIKN